MKIAYVTNHDARDVQSFSGTSYFMSRGLAEFNEVHYIGPLKRRVSRLNKLRRSYNKRVHQKKEHCTFYPEALAGFARAVADQLHSHPCDIVLSPLWAPLSRLNGSQPAYIWTDIALSSLAGEYYDKSELSARGWRQMTAATLAAVERCERVFLGSEWARQRMLQEYPIAPEKIRVLPLGANIDFVPTRQQIMQAINGRDFGEIRLLFIGVDWYRKGAAVALAVAEGLHARGVKVRLTLVGSKPPPGTVIPDYVEMTGFLSKRDVEGRGRLYRLLASAHFFILPTRAEAFGVPYCEAKAFCLPCLATRVGPVPELVRDGSDGQTFELGCPIEDYVDHIIALTRSEEAYRQQAIAALNDYHTRFSWDVLTRQFITEIHC